MWAEAVEFSARIVRRLRAATVTGAVLAGCAVLVLVHQWYHRDFLIDDAGICFAYARNIASGEGIVAIPGGERVEGFSDPTWIAVLVLFQWLGLSGFVVAKPLAALFAVAGVPLVHRLAVRAMPDHDGPAALFAPIAFALSAQLAIWSASGLENGLWCLLLAWAILATVDDATTGRFLGSSVAWLLLSWTRPEGLVYAACGAFWYLVILSGSGKPMRRPVALWLAVFWVPTIALELARLWYFAWPLPNTWYAKIDTRATFPLRWTERGWLQVREFARRLWHGFWLPLYVLGLLGLGGRRGRIAIAVIVVVGIAFLWPPPDNLAALSIWPTLPAAPVQWLVARIVLVVGVLVLLPLAAIGRPGWEVRVLCWHTAALAVLFSVYANGDWMGGFRWMSLLVPSVAVLFACGLREVVDAVAAWAARPVPEPVPGGEVEPDWDALVDDPALAAKSAAGPEDATYLLPRPKRVPQRPAPRAAAGGDRWGTAGWLVAAFGVGSMIPPNLAQSRDHRRFNADETVPRIALRAAFTKSIVDRTFHEGRVTNLEMDQGGHLWFRPEWTELDMAGLIDIPMSRHTYDQRPFVEEYVFTEHTPTFAHVHGWWAKYTAFQSYPQWKDYVALPLHRDLPPAPPWHDGMYAHRSLFAAPRWAGTPRKTGFADGVTLEGFDVPADIWSRGGEGFVELGFGSRARAAGEEPRVIGFLTEGREVVASWDLPVGYGLLSADQWRTDVLIGRYAVHVPAEVAPGRYELGFVALSA
ncbi:MAG: hypothetical protein ABMB14_31650, partial [Myxococcota bacterium]